MSGRASPAQRPSAAPPRAGAARRARKAAPGESRVRLYRLPARQVLDAVPAGSVSVLMTDPAYTSVERNGGSGHLRRWFRGGLPWPEIGRLLAIARRKLRPDGVAFVMTNGQGLRDALTAMERAGFARVRVVTWDRCYPGLGAGLRHQTEFVLVGLLPGSRLLAGVDLIAVPAVGPGTAGRWPTEKPEGLGRKLAAIAGVGPRDVVLDPFCGSGALLVGAAERGATVIGSDVAAGAIRRAAGKLRGRAGPGPAWAGSRSQSSAGRGPRAGSRGRGDRDG